MRGRQDPQVIRLRRTAYNLVRMAKLLAPASLQVPARLKSDACDFLLLAYWQVQ